MNPLNNWLKELQQSHGLVLKQVGFLEPELFCFELTFKFLEQNIVACGSATSIELALTKAAAELSERICCVAHKLPSSNGVAAHFIRAAAISNGVFELSERNALLQHWVHNSIGHEVKAASLPPPLKAIQERLEQQGHRFVFRELGSQEGAITTLCYARGNSALRPYGAILGAACDVTFEKSAEKAFEECAWSVAAHSVRSQAEELAVLSLEEFLKLKKPEPLHRKQLALDISFWKLVEDSFVPIDGPVVRGILPNPKDDFSAVALTFPKSLPMSPFECWKIERPGYLSFEDCLVNGSFGTLPHVFG